MNKKQSYASILLLNFLLLSTGSNSAASGKPDNTKADAATQAVAQGAEEPALFQDGFEAIDTSISLEERWAAMTAAGEYFDSLGPIPVADKNAAMLAWLLAHPLIGDAGIEADTVWAYFLDGLPILFADNRRDSSPQAPAAARTRSKYSPVESVSSLSRSDTTGTQQIEGPPNPVFFDAELPRSKNVLFIDAFRSGWPSNDVSPHIQQRFVDVGYSLLPYSTDSTPTIAELKAQVADLGVFFITTHGSVGRFEDKVVGVVGSYYAYQSRIPLNRGEFEARASDVLSKRLVPFRASLARDEGGNTIATEWTWGITERFVETYFNFSEDSLVFIDACNSSRDRMRNAFVAAGANVYMGWNDSVYANEAAASQDMLFRRLLGSDQIVDSEDLKNVCDGESFGFELIDDSSPVRPFDRETVMQEMFHRGRLLDCDDTELTLHREEASDFAVLVPSLRSAQEFAASGTLHLYGLFGDDPANTGGSRQVFLDDMPLTIQSWSQWEIVVDLPAGAHGELYVSKRDIAGNKLVLTRYTGVGSAVFVSSVDGEFATADFTLEFRADFSPFRVLPDDEPVYWNSPEFSAYGTNPEFQERLAGRYAELTAGGGNRAYFAGASELSYNYFGNLTTTSCPFSGSVSGGGTLPALLLDPTSPPPPEAMGFLGSATLSLLDPPSVPLYVLGLSAPGATATYANAGCPNFDGLETDLISFGLGSTQIKAAPGEMGTIEGGEFVSDPIPVLGFEFTTTITLPTLVPQSPHDPDTYPD
jgi:hypothetical protein